MNYIIYGEETYQVRKAVDAIIKKQIKERDDMNTVVYNALQSDVSQVLADAQTIPFLTDKKCIIIENANFLTASDDTGWNPDVLLDYMKQPMDSTVMIMTCPAAKLDMRKKVVKALISCCKVSVCNRLDQGSLPPYVKEQSEKRKITMTPQAFTLLCDRLPYDIAIIQNELDKLSLYGDNIDETVIKTLVSPVLEEDVFALVNAVVEKNTKRMFAIWEDMQIQNKEPIQMIALIASQFHLLYQVKHANMNGYHNHEDIAKELGVHPYRVKLALRMVPRFSIDALLHVLAELAKLDQNIKGGKIDKKIGFELFLLQVGEWL